MTHLSIVTPHETTFEADAAEVFGEVVEAFAP